jgi:mannosylglycerate hydrolase
LERWAEKFNTVAWAFGFDYPEDRFEQAWKTLLLNHTHDDLCGCCIDPIARDMQERFAEVHRMATIMSSESLLAIAQSVDTSAVDGLAILVFNPSSRPRQEVVPISLDLPEEMDDFCIQDSEGHVYPYQLISRIGRKVDLYLWGDRIPSVGYKTYYVKAGACRETIPYAKVHASATECTMENKYLKVQVNPDGTLTIHDKIQKDTYENLGYFEDGGDAGDTYDYSYPENDTLFTTLGKPALILLEAAGPLLARFCIETDLDLPLELSADRKSRAEATRKVSIFSFVELSAQAGHVEVRTHVHNVVKDHRLRVLFPTGIDTDRAFAGMPFDIATFLHEDPHYGEQVPEQLAGVMLAGRYTAPVNTHPFRHFVTLTDDEKSSLSVFSHGLMEYEVLPKGKIIALTLVRGVGWLTRQDLLLRVGDVGPHIFTPEAQCLGPLTFEYSIFPHGGDLNKANPIFESDRHSLKFRAVQTNQHPGRLPDEFSFFSWVSEKPQKAFKLNALKKAEDGDGFIIRLFNKLDHPARGQIKIGGQVNHAWRTNLNEEVQEELRVEDGTIPFKARGKEIVTIKVSLKPWRLIDDYHAFASRVLPSPVEDEARLTEVFSNGTLPSVITPEEVQREQQRARQLLGKLNDIRSKAYILNEALNAETHPRIERLTALHRLQGEEATLSRQSHEARISALLNEHLLVTRQMETELTKIGEDLNWARVRKRVGEFMIHYYEGLENAP